MSDLSKTETALVKLIGYIIAILLCPLVFYWYNHVLYWKQLSYWQWFIVAIGWIVSVHTVKPLRHLAALVFVACLLIQCLAWVGVVTPPLIKP